MTFLLCAWFGFWTVRALYVTATQLLFDPSLEVHRVEVSGWSTDWNFRTRRIAWVKGVPRGVLIDEWVYPGDELPLAVYRIGPYTLHAELVDLAPLRA